MCASALGYGQRAIRRWRRWSALRAISASTGPSGGNSDNDRPHTSRGRPPEVPAPTRESPERKFEKASSRVKSPPIPAQAGKAMTGLSHNAPGSSSRQPVIAGRAERSRSRPTGAGRLCRPQSRRSRTRPGDQGDVPGQVSRKQPAPPTNMRATSKSNRPRALPRSMRAPGRTARRRPSRSPPRPRPTRFVVS